LTTFTFVGEMITSLLNINKVRFGGFLSSWIL